MRPISLVDIWSLNGATQHFSDCYLISSVSALSRCKNGERIIRQNIMRNGENYLVRFNNVNGSFERYLVKPEDYNKCVRNPNVFTYLPIIQVIEAAMGKLINVHPNKKTFISRLFDIYKMRYLRKFEANKPSRFMEMFTGVKPIILNEQGLKMSLKKHKNEAIALFNAMGEHKDNCCFVFGTGYKRKSKFSNFHCYEFVNASPETKTIELTEHNSNKSIILTYEEAIKNFKYICGYFDSMLAPKSEVLK